MLRELNADNFQTEVLDNDKGVVVMFTAPWCGACRITKPELLKVARRGFKVGTVDIDKEGDLGFKVEALPTILVFKRNKAQVKWVGAAKERDLVKLVEESGVKPQAAERETVVDDCGDADPLLGAGRNPEKREG